MKLSTVMKSLVAATVMASPVAFAHGTHAVYQPKENIVAQKRTQVDGYYRMMIGDYEVTALYDGYLFSHQPNGD